MYRAVKQLFVCACGAVSALSYVYLSYGYTTESNLRYVNYVKYSNTLE